MPTISDIGGGNNDFPDLISWGNARGSSPDLEIAHVYSDQFLTKDFDHRSDFTGGYEVVGMGNDFVGDFTDTGVITITRDPAYTSWLIDDRTGRGHWRNLIIDCVDGNILFRSGVARFEATNVGFKSDNAPAFDETASTFDGVFNQCAFWSASNDAASFRNGQVALTDCILVGNDSTAFGTCRIRGMTGVVTNTVAHERQGSLCFGADGSIVTGSGCVSTDASATTLLIGSQDASLPTYFENISNGDLRINAAGQAALPASLSWAYVSTGGGTLNISPSSTISEELFGIPSVAPLGVTLLPPFTDTEEVLGIPSVFSAGVSVQPVAISSSEVLGELQVIPLGVNLSPNPITSQEVVQGPVVAVGLTVLNPAGVESEEVVPEPLLDLMLKQLLVPSVPDTFSVGRPIVAGGDRIVIPVVSRTNFTEMQRYLTTLGFKGALEDVILTWLRSEGYEGQWNDAWYAYLEAEGLEGSLTDKRSKWRKQ